MAVALLDARLGRRGTRPRRLQLLGPGLRRRRATPRRGSQPTRACTRALFGDGHRGAGGRDVGLGCFDRRHGGVGRGAPPRRTAAARFLPWRRAASGAPRRAQARLAVATDARGHAPRRRESCARAASTWLSATAMPACGLVDAAGRRSGGRWRSRPTRSARLVPAANRSWLGRRPAPRWRDPRPPGIARIDLREHGALLDELVVGDVQLDESGRRRASRLGDAPLDLGVVGRFVACAEPVDDAGDGRDRHRRQGTQRAGPAWLLGLHLPSLHS